MGEWDIVDSCNQISSLLAANARQTELAGGLGVMFLGVVDDHGTIDDVICECCYSSPQVGPYHS